MAMICVENTVPDYSQWRIHFDKNAPGRAAAGLSNPRIFRNADNGNHIFVIADTLDAAKARQALESPEYRSRMREGGVTTPPKIYIID